MNALLAACLSLTAASASALDLEETFRTALVNDPIYQAALAQKGVTDAQKKQARAALLPTITMSGSWVRKTKDTFLSTTTQTNRTYPGNLTFSLKQPLLQMDKITGFKQIDLNTNGGELQLAQARQDLINRSIQAYFTALLAEKNASIAAEQERNTGLQLKIVKRSFEVGNTTIIDTHEAEAAYYRAKAAAISAANVAANARSALEDMMGKPLDPKEKLAPLKAPLALKMPVPDTQEMWVSRAKDQSYAVRIAKIAYQVADLDVTRRAQQRLPVIDFVASQSFDHTNFQRASDTVTNARSTTQIYGLQLSMPLFDGGLISAQVQEGDALRTKSFQTLRSTQTQIAQATRTAYNQAVSGLATIAALESAKSSAAASVKSNEIGRTLGMRINIDVLNAEQTHAQTQYDLAKAQFDTVVGNVNLKAAISKLSDEDVRYINALLEPRSKKANDTTPVNTDLSNRMNDPLPAADPLNPMVLKDAQTSFDEAKSTANSANK